MDILKTQESCGDPLYGIQMAIASGTFLELLGAHAESERREIYNGAYGYLGDYSYNSSFPLNAIKLCKVPKPAETALFFECPYGNVTPSLTVGTFGYFDNVLTGGFYGGSRHRNIELVNMVYVDGHAKSLTHQEYGESAWP